MIGAYPVDSWPWPAIDFYNTTQKAPLGMVVLLASRVGATTGEAKLMRAGGRRRGMSLEEAVDYLAEELDLERSEHVREVGEAVADLQD